MNWKLISEIVLFVLGCAGLYVAFVCLKIWVIEKGRPREEMFMCQVHGMMRKKNVITFAGAEYCPKCFHERLAASEEIR